VATPCPRRTLEFECIFNAVRSIDDQAEGPLLS
jgi:hypothetical protein